jgi:CTP synthase
MVGRRNTRSIIALAGAPANGAAEDRRGRGEGAAEPDRLTEPGRGARLRRTPPSIGARGEGGGRMEPSQTRYVFVTGGVVSSLGKGIAAAALGRILKSRGVRVSIQKLDPYVNVDPGTMSPFEHGEVFVLEEGSETDLDLGHYERFIDENLPPSANVTTGQIYQEVIARERHGDYLGKTVQMIPHVTNELKRRIRLAAQQSEAEVLIVEVGGTVGDIEGLPFIEAIRQMRNDVGRQNVLYIHLTLMPHIGATGELKTKPTQHSVKELRSIGIQPDVIIARSDRPMPDELRDKIALFTDVPREAVVPLLTLDTIYAVPLELERYGLGDLVSNHLGLPIRESDLSEWRKLVDRVRTPKPTVTIAVVGKYVELPDAYKSVAEALRHAGLHHGVDMRLAWVDSEELERGRDWDVVEAADGIVVPGGFGHRGIEGKVRAARLARERRVPYLGLCLGLQIMVIELARHVVGNDEPNSTEFDPGTHYPVIDLLPEQVDVRDMGGTMRLGAWPCRIVPGTRTAAAYGVDLVRERHRHRFEVNPAFLPMLQGAGLVVSGVYTRRDLVDVAEIRDHPFMIGSQFHPEFKSRPLAPHPLFRDFVGAANQHRIERTSAAMLAEASTEASVLDAPAAVAKDRDGVDGRPTESTGERDRDP